MISLFSLHIDNVLIDIGSDLKFKCSICDFGFANFVGEDRPLATGMKKPTTIGISTRYAAPEVNLEHETQKSLTTAY